ncbi:5-formyltetrahydrofolate cyclo-ligase [Geodermatophilus sp. YIM 151500]|uniref:5-formyltetrahydrofolate cyclo-ligase n=1 Tax=Geodermatophilus sp. YIM 151500 TaxID=2984531 RepID=UPI0021E4F0B2|nr:5-formyltetrahydrofolate cyclo-ligase [Geodermatophilus sp. YIM 151500]MCV2489589.1 5-formyltetrahydrofolate cyclo-ligase [Geodermatophilus sp. YIM 151500]
MGSPSAAAAAKEALRERVLARRAARPAGERAAAAAAVATTLLRGLSGSRTFAAFVPEETEPGHGRLPAVFTRLRARVLLPVVPPTGRELGWAVDTGRLAPGRFGLLEPVGPRLGPTAIGTADTVVVPALAVARDGIRLGRGGGYYDRALRHARPGATLVAVVFDDELLDELPAEEHDHRVTAVVTPSGGWQPLG